MTAPVGETTHVRAVAVGNRIILPATEQAFVAELAHITFWEQRLVAYIDGARESLIHPGEDESAAIGRINADVLAANRDRPLAEVRAAFASSYQQVLALAESLSADDLADEELYGLFAGDTFEHYREHIGMLETLEPKE